jgi:hypothetical protein
MQPNYYQPYQNNYQYQQPSYQQPMQRNMFALINGIEDVRTFIVQPNQIVYLLDTTSNHFYIKKADMSGRYVIEEYLLVKAEQEQNDYVKKSDFQALQAQIETLTRAFENKKGE